MLHLAQTAKSTVNKVKNMLSRGIVKLTNDGSKTQAMQLNLFAGESRDNVEHPQEYGFTSKAHSGAEAIVAFFGGNRDHGTVLTVFDKRHRVTNLQDGEVCIYNHEGTRIHLKNGNELYVKSNLKVTIESPTIRFIGNLEVTGEIKDRCDSDGKTMEAMRNIYDAHRHQETGSLTNIPRSQDQM